MSKISKILLVFSRKVLAIVHLLIVIYLIFGWLAATNDGLLAHIISTLVIMLHWKLNKGNCILTDLDHKVELKLFGENSKKEIKKEPFTRILLRKFGIEINDKNLERLIYAVLYVSIIISVIKLR